MVPGSTISIHAPRVGSDIIEGGAEGGLNYFNPRSPCGERHDKSQEDKVIKEFQSTLPVWGATYLSFKVEKDEIFQSTLPVWGATRDAGAIRPEKSEFQSTLPVWGATMDNRARLGK